MTELKINYADLYTRVNFLEIPEGWGNLATELYQKISFAIETGQYSDDVAGEWHISAMDVNKNGKFTISGKHIISNFVDIIKQTASHAENVCCICGWQGSIVSIPNGIRLPLCKAHHDVACDPGD
jgi:hypothetical protein